MIKLRGIDDSFQNLKKDALATLSKLVIKTMEFPQTLSLLAMNELSGRRTECTVLAGVPTS
ncbi:hypothetical protein [Leptospira tipperaryensis]|uniref:hypothetical protein n=1 Tax=Leptospira tipperaryensis TaxID=2564040 RepID=UPI0012E9DB0E|nr:hypothetical protein [Leptospira tipperaryensis]